MRITFVLPYASLAGGVRVAVIYARKFIEMGHEVHVVSHKRRPIPLRRRLREFMANPKKGLNPPPPVSDLDFLGDRHIVLDDLSRIRAEDFPDADVIIATWWTTAYAVSVLPPEKGRKFYFVQHHEVHDHLPSQYSSGSYYLPLEKITISQWLKGVMAERYGDPDVPIVQNSVDMELFKAPSRGRQAQPTVGLLYAPEHFKGIDVALKAIEIAKQTVPDLHVVAFGTRPVRPDLPLPPGSTYHQQPPQQSIRNIYAACDAWLFASRVEGFGLPLLEAMACRTPVLATRAGAAGDLITPGENGHIVDVEDHEALGARLADVLAAPEDKWKAMSDAAHARAQSYTWDDAARKFLGHLGADQSA